MAAYDLLIKRNAEKELCSISQPYLSKILNKIKSLQSTPRPQGAIMLKGNNQYFRIRLGDYRVIYSVDDKNKSVTIIKVGHRREVYE